MSNQSRREQAPEVLVLVHARSSRAAKHIGTLLGTRFENIRMASRLDIVSSPKFILLLNGWAGLDPVAALRECRQRFTAPVLVLVAYRQARWIPELLRGGAIDCARWPICDGELLARVETRMQPTPTEIALDGVTLMFRCGGVRVRLTPSEFRVVHHLLEDPLRWSTTEEITIAALRPAGSSKSLLRGIVHSLRRKLQTEAWRLLYERTRGYRFNVRPAQRDVESDDSKTPA
jgi:two-component system response regulator AdeR